MVMVALALKPSRALASCCIVLVVNGGSGLRVPVVWLVLATVKVVPFRLFRKLLASSSVAKSVFSVALNWSPVWVNWPTALKVEVGWKLVISRSRSTSKRTAGDCTRPADLPPGTLRQTTGLSSKPTRRSRIWRACWAWTRSMSMCRGCLIAS